MRNRDLGISGSMRYVGARVLRSEDPRFLTGRASYTDDVEPPDTLHAAFLRSPHAHADVVSIDTARASVTPGVAAVLVQADFEAVLDPVMPDLQRPEVHNVARHVLDSSRAYYVGQPVAMVLAENRYTAEDGVEAIEVEWDPLPAVLDPEEAMQPGAPIITDGIPGNNYARIELEQGPVDELFDRAEHVFSTRFHHGRVQAAPLETRGTIAAYDFTTGELTIWTSTQVPSYVRSFGSGPLRIPEAKIRVIADAVGGGFGHKGYVLDEDLLVAAACRIAGRPVKWIEDRMEHLAASLHAKDMICYIDIAVDADGRFLAFRGHYISGGGAWQAYPWTGVFDSAAGAALLPNIYNIQAVRYRADNPVTNRCPIGAYRGIGWSPAHVAREALIDDVARALEMDPVDLRLKNCIDDEPFVSTTGMRYDGGSYQESIRHAREMVDYEAFREKQAESRKEGRYLGIGFSAYIEPTAFGAAGSAVNGLPFEFFDSASVTVEPDGSVTVTTGLHNHGQGHETSLAQLAADVLGVRFEDVRVIENDTGRAVYGSGTYASRSAVIGGGSIIRAGKDVREKLVRLAAHAMEVAPDDIELADGVASVRGVPGASMTVSELAYLGYFGGSKRPEGEPALTSTRSYDPPETYSNGTCVAIVEVDVETGLIDVQRIAYCDDCGTMLNPMIVEGQLTGGVVQAIGAALLEELVYSEDGQLLSSTLMDYLYPSSAESPPFDISHLTTPSTVTEGGIKGVGESGMLGGGAAVVNAVADALSAFGRIQIRKTPITPSEVLKLVSAAKATDGTPADSGGM
jgi:carbon-monoxide dehydrogenase large subunit